MTKTVDPRGIRRTVTAVEHRTDAERVTFECGHVADMAPHHDWSHEIGEFHYCYRCGLEARAANPGARVA